VRVGDRVISSKTVKPRRGTLLRRVRDGARALGVPDDFGALWQIEWDESHLPKSMEWERDLTVLDAVTRLAELADESR